MCAGVSAIEHYGHWSYHRLSIIWLNVKWLFGARPFMHE